MRRPSSSALAAGAWCALLATLPACRGAAPPPPPTEQSGPRDEPGVFADRLVLSSTAVFTGPNASWGADTWRGSAAYLAEINAKGGVHGRKLEVTAVDDGYETKRALENVTRLIEKNDFFVFYNFVGSNVMVGAVAELGRHRAKDVFQFGSVASSSGFRSGPDMDRAFVVRAPITMEVKIAVDAFFAAGKTKFGVFYQDDLYGRSGLDAVNAELAARQTKPVSALKHSAFLRFDEPLRAEVEELRAAGAEVIFDIGNAQAAAALVRDARQSQWHVPIVQTSGVHDTFVRTLLAYEKKTNAKVATDLFGTKVVPSPGERQLPLVAQYLELVERHNPKPPGDLTEAAFRQAPVSFHQVEGFVNAKVLVEILRRMGPKPTRARFKDAAESLRSFDVGLGDGAAITFGPGDHTGLDRVWLYAWSESDWVPVKHVATSLGEASTPSSPDAGARDSSPRAIP